MKADSLEKYEMATLEFGCSITELSIEVSNNEKVMGFGFWKKTFIICAVCKTDKVIITILWNLIKIKSVNIEDVGSRLENSNKDSVEKDCKTTLANKRSFLCVFKKLNQRRFLISFIMKKNQMIFQKIIIKKSKDEIISEIKVV